MVHHALVFGQIVRLEEAEAFEEFVTRRQVLEDLDHQGRHLAPDLDEFLFKTDAFEGLANIGDGTQGLDIQVLADGRAEEDVFGDRGVGRELLRVEDLDKVGQLRIPEPGMDGGTGLEDLVRQVR